MKYLSIWIWACMLSFLSSAKSKSAADDPEYILEHDLGLGTFSQRGKINLPEAKRKDAEATATQSELSDEDLHILSYQDHKTHGLYRLKLKGLEKEDGNTTLVMGYTQAKDLKLASLHDIITIFSNEAGNVVSLSVRPMSNILETSGNTEFNTMLITETPAPAPAPNTAGFLEKLKEEKLQKEKADKEPKSFFAKYWMYIVPVVVFMLMSNAAQPQQGN